MSATITASTRSLSGKGGARKARLAGLVPGIMYGAVKQPVPLNLQARELSNLLAKEGESGLIELIVRDEQGKTVGQQKAVIRHIDYHPLREVPIHVDFLAVAMDRKLTISIPVQLSGDPVGVTRNKGMMSQIIYEVEIECLPANIPHAMIVDVTNMDIGHALHVSELPALEGVRVLTAAGQTIVTVEAPKEEVVAEAVVEEVAAAAEPEVITKRKEEEAEA
jgi:large subunit ribosomal protein L25